MHWVAFRVPISSLGMKWCVLKVLPSRPACYWKSCLKGNLDSFPKSSYNCCCCCVAKRVWHSVAFLYHLFVLNCSFIFFIYEVVKVKYLPFHSNFIKSPFNYWWVNIWFVLYSSLNLIMNCFLIIFVVLMVQHINLTQPQWFLKQNQFSSPALIKDSWQQWTLFEKVAAPSLCLPNRWNKLPPITDKKNK